MRRCAACGQTIYDGELAYVDADGSTYCSADCVATVHAEEVIVGTPEDLPYDGGPTWTYEEAVLEARVLERLQDRLRSIATAWRIVATERSRDGNAIEAVTLTTCAAQIEDALFEASDEVLARRREGAATCES